MPELDMNGPRGLITSITGSSFVDGPGIRTTLFLKGCPLRCLWCCNPETQHHRIEKNRLYPQKGNSEFFGRWYTAGEVMEIIEKDTVYFRRSQGGVTIAGGEPTFQPAFTLELIDRCRKLGIPTALDTCGYTENEYSVKALEEADLLLFDLKIMDSRKHKQYTGCSNEIILENFRRRAGLKKDVIVRVPLIPGYTDTLENIKDICDFVTNFGDSGSIRQIDLIGYHLGGVIKYDMLARKYPLGEQAKPQSEEFIQQIKETFILGLHGLCPVFLGGG